MSSALVEGSIFASRYRVLRCIASGGMGAVYEVVHLETERRRALKVMLPHILGSAELRERFQREARVAAQIDSEFIVDVFDAGVDDATGMPFMVMELLRGEELGKRIARAGRLPAEEALDYLHQTALALDKTHRASIVHRDLKPENLFLTEREDGTTRIKVLDFGIAKVLADGATRAKVTRGMGTPVYMAPEQFDDGHVTPAADIYALGMVAYDLLVGEPYWEEELNRKGAYAFVATAMTGPAEPAVARAARRGVALPQGFDGWFATATAIDPARRFATATGAVDALGQVFGVPSLRPAQLEGASPHRAAALGSAPPAFGGSAPLSPVSRAAPARAEAEHLGLATTGLATTGEATTRPFTPRRRARYYLAGALAVAATGAVGAFVHVARGVQSRALDAVTAAQQTSPAITAAPPATATATEPVLVPPALTGAPATSAGVTAPRASAAPRTTKTVASTTAAAPRGAPAVESVYTRE